MPELPEVETTARFLRPQLVGRTITHVHLGWPRHTPDPDDLLETLPGHRIEDVGRRGKYILFYLEPDDRMLLIHLKMSGRLDLVPPDSEPDRHAHTVLTLDDRQLLRFSDVRKFGRVLLLADPDQLLGRLGPEPLSDTFSAAELAGALAKRRRAIKPLLLEQSFIAGIGNIYADESLFRAHIHPRRPANSLTSSEVLALYASIRQVLTEAILHQGTTLDWVYPDGSMQDRLRVYGRQGEGCVECGGPVERMVMAQRGTHFCPQCQR